MSFTSMRRLALAGVAAAFATAGLSGCSLLGMQKAEPLEVGQCFDIKEAKNADEIADYTVVDCTEPHQYQAASVFDLPDSDEYPGQAAIQKQAEEKCIPAFEEFIGVSVDESKLEYTYVFPLESSWKLASDRQVVCVVSDNTNPKLTEDLKGSAR